MGARKLQFSDNLPVTKLEWKSGQDRCEIEVPAGESHYLLSQSNEDSLYVFHLRHPASRVLITGLVESIGETAPCLRTEVIHHAASTQAETLIRTVAHDNSHPHYEGLIAMEEAAQGSESYLSHHSLLLGEGSRSWSIPSLEIKANQVKCSHAATVRTLTDMDLFYPRSRGLDEMTARKLLVEAFVADLS